MTMEENRVAEINKEKTEALKEAIKQNYTEIRLKVKVPKNQ